MRVGGWAKKVIKKLRRKNWRGEVQWGSVRIKLKSEENRKDKREKERRRGEEKEKRKKERRREEEKGRMKRRQTENEIRERKE